MSGWHNVYIEEWNELVGRLNEFYVEVREVPNNAAVFLTARVAASLDSDSVKQGVEGFESLQTPQQAAVLQILMALRELKPWFSLAYQTAAADTPRWYLDDPVLEDQIVRLSTCTNHFIDQLR